MSPPSPYSPDRSLSIAAAVLVGSGLLVAAAVYLLMTSADTLTGRYQGKLAEDRAQERAWSGTDRPRRSAASTRSAPSAQSAPAPNRVPAWAGSGTPVLPPRSPTPETYDVRSDQREEGSRRPSRIRPDMGHADLGSPSSAPSAGWTGAGAPLAETDGPADGSPGPSAGHAPLTADLGDSPSGASPDWRSEASTLGRRARALSGALARLDRENRSANQNSRAAGESSSASGDASTAATDRGSRTASDPPDPPPPPPEVPVDGGLGWLAAAGAAYAANRLRRNGDEEDADA